VSLLLITTINKKSTDDYRGTAVILYSEPVAPRLESTLL